MVQAEELLERGQQVVIVDPTGAHWGLRTSADGKSAGYAIAIFGGEHGDAPLESTAGEVVADAIATEHFSAILDVTMLLYSGRTFGKLDSFSAGRLFNLTPTRDDDQGLI